MTQSFFNKKGYKEYIILGIIIFLFITLYSLMSIVNHLNFRSFGDLALMNNELYDYSRFKFNNPSLIQGKPIPNVLADHFSVIKMLFVPLYYLFGQYTLLIVQIASIIIGGIGVYKVSNLYFDKKVFSYLLLIHFYSLFAIFNSLTFDYHDGVVGALMIPWLYYFIIKNAKIEILLTLLFILLSKENYGLLMGFFLIGTLFVIKPDWAKVRVISSLAVFSWVYFLIITQFVIPAIGDIEQFCHFDYGQLGETPKEVLLFVLQNPKETFSRLFESYNNDPMLTGIKSEMLWTVILSGGFTIFNNIGLLIMFVPVYMQKMLNDNPVIWGVGTHYSIEMVGIISIGMIEFVRRLKYKNIYKTIIVSIIVILTMSTTVSQMYERKSIWHVPEIANIFDSRHYSRNFDTKKVRKALTQIDRKYSVSAQNALLPHLSDRETIYPFPYIRDAELIILNPSDEQYYPIDKNEYFRIIDSLSMDNNWVLDTSELPLYIFREAK